MPCQYCDSELKLEEHKSQTVSYHDTIKGRITTRLFCTKECMDNYKRTGPKQNNFKYVIE